jgi:hypothetical protein
MRDDEIELQKVDGVWVARKKEQEQQSKKRDLGFEIAFWTVAAVVYLTMVLYDIAIGRLPNPLSLFGAH